MPSHAHRRVQDGDTEFLIDAQVDKFRFLDLERDMEYVVEPDEALGPLAPRGDLAE